MTWKDVNSNLSIRHKDTLSANIDQQNSNTINFLLSSNDQGVIRNGGRNGSLYGPQAIFNSLKKMANTSLNTAIKVSETSQTNHHDFSTYQQEQIEIISTKINNKDNFIHLGSGHDHIYPFVMALSKINPRISVINLDAHLDTRNDPISHSGTPFRQLKNELKDNLNLVQVGIHQYSNASSNFDGVEMDIHLLKDVKKKTKNFTDNKDYLDTLFEPLKNDIVIISIDLDAIDGREMSAVSAVNQDGLSLNFVRELLEKYKASSNNQKLLGIYEYNPLFDDLCASNARAICSLIYSIF